MTSAFKSVLILVIALTSASLLGCQESAPGDPDRPAVREQLAEPPPTSSAAAVQGRDASASGMSATQTDPEAADRSSRPTDPDLLDYFKALVRSWSDSADTATDQPSSHSQNVEGRQ